MIFVTGPLYAGKRDCIRRLLGLSEKEFSGKAVWDVQELAEPGGIDQLADKLSAKEIVIATEVGCGVIPIDASAREKREREKREAAGQLACALAGRADTVIRVCCGIPQLLKGDWPCRSS